MGHNGTEVGVLRGRECLSFRAVNRQNSLVTAFVRGSNPPALTLHCAEDVGKTRINVHNDLGKFLDLGHVLLYEAQNTGPHVLS